MRSAPAIAASRVGMRRRRSACPTGPRLRALPADAARIHRVQPDQPHPVGAYAQMGDETGAKGVAQADGDAERELGGRQRRQRQLQIQAGVLIEQPRGQAEQREGGQAGDDQLQLVSTLAQPVQADAPRGFGVALGAAVHDVQPRRAASMAAMSILRICIMAAKARAATPGSGSLIASISTRGVICQHSPQRSLHQPQSLS